MSTRTPDPLDDPALRALGRELREAVGGELRSDAEEAERLAALRARRRRTLAELAAELAVRGDRVAVGLVGVTLHGTVVRAAGDLLTVRTAGGVVDVNTSAVHTLQVTEPSTGSAPPPPSGPSGFKARLYELELAGTPVLLGVAGDELPGRITAVAVDHLLLAGPDGTERAVSLAAVTRVREEPR